MDENLNEVLQGQEPSIEVDATSVEQVKQEDAVIKEEKTEESVEKEKKEEDSDTASSEEPSTENEEKPEENIGEDSDVPPPEEEKEKGKSDDVDAKEESTEDVKEDGNKQEEKQAEKVDESTEEEKTETEDNANDVDKLKAELEELKEAEEERKGLADLSNIVQKAEYQFEKVLNGIQKALNDTLDQYGIDKTKSLDEIRKEDPAKAAIAEDLIRQANQVKEFNEVALNKQVTDKQNELIFKKAEKVFNKYNLSHKQAEVAADTFIQIMLNVGVADLNVDLSAKVELAAARAKMLVPDEVIEAVDKEVEDIEDVVDVPEAEEVAEKEKSKEKTATVEEHNEVVEPEVTVEKPALDAFKEGAADGVPVASNSNPVTADNVLDILASLPFREQTAFYAKHEHLINEAARKRRR